MFYIFALFSIAGVVCYGKVFLFSSKENPAEYLMSRTNIQKAYETAFVTDNEKGVVCVYWTELSLTELIDIFLKNIQESKAILNCGNMALIAKDGNPSFSWLFISLIPYNKTAIFQIAKERSAQAHRNPIPLYPAAEKIWSAQLSHGTSLLISETSDNSASVYHFYNSEFTKKGMAQLYPQSMQKNCGKIYANEKNVCIITTSAGKKKGRTRIAVLHKEQINN